MSYGLAAVEVLWRRELLRFGRQPARLAGALGQPLILWLVLGGGLSSTFVLPGERLDYLAYFFPGVLVMTLLFASIFSSASLIEDRHQGFLQAVLAGPSSRAALVAGKCLGGSSVALLQAVLLVALAPLAGFTYASVHWPLLAIVALLTTLALSALGFAAAWILDSVQGYHAVQMTLLVPLWVVSGAMFPPAGGHPVLVALMAVNPLAYAVAGVRAALHGGAPPPGTALVGSSAAIVGVLAAFAVAAFAVATLTARRIHRKRV